MGKFNTNYTTYLEEQFGDRVTFNKTERKLYSHDVGDLPNLVKKLVGETTADAVVQPETEDEIVKLVKWARENRVPITPRGKATSGYGGVVPLKKGDLTANLESRALHLSSIRQAIWQLLPADGLPRAVQV
jgi:FAD/FMN-containing dehydrogenase